MRRCRMDRRRHTDRRGIAGAAVGLQLHGDRSASRHVAPDEARRRITAPTTGAHRVYKIDSTLRGNWSIETPRSPIPVVGSS